MLGTNDLVHRDASTSTAVALPMTRGGMATTWPRTRKFSSDLFEPGSDHSSAIAKYLTDDINRRRSKLEKDNARRES